jgi:hypothetical protein
MQGKAAAQAGGLDALLAPQRDVAGRPGRGMRVNGSGSRAERVKG